MTYIHKKCSRWNFIPIRIFIKVLERELDETQFVYLIISCECSTKICLWNMSRCQMIWCVYRKANWCLSPFTPHTPLTTHSRGMPFFLSTSNKLDDFMKSVALPLAFKAKSVGFKLNQRCNFLSLQIISGDLLLLRSSRLINKINETIIKDQISRNQREHNRK